MWLRRLLCVFLTVLGGINGFAQSCDPPFLQYGYEVWFTDKQGSPPLSDSALFLSPRSLARRAAQGLQVDSTDQPVSTPYIDSVLAVTSASNGRIHVTSKWLNMCVVLVTDTTTIAPLRAKPFINKVKLVAVYNGMVPKIAPKLGPLAKTTGTSSYYGNTWLGTLMVNGDYLHDNGYKGQGKLIAVLDAGFMGADTHIGFDSLHAAGGYVDVHNFTYNNDNVYGYDSHGLSALSTMAGYLPGPVNSSGLVYVGSAPLAQYALYITEDDQSEQPIELDNMVAGTERADSVGADVISVSLGYDTFCGYLNDDLVFATDLDGKSTVAARGANLATKKGILFVASAGNEGIGVPGFGNHILTPGDADSAITIGAVDLNHNNASTSGYGPNAAGQIKPDVCLLGVQVPVFHTQNLIVNEDGTSFSTPQLAGWAACLWQASGSQTTPYMLRRAINMSADHYNNTGAQIGYGIPDFKKAFLSLSVNDTPVLPSTSPIWVIAETNPFVGNISLSVKLPGRGEVTFVLTDISGKTIVKSTQALYPGWNPRTTIPVLSSLAAGMYILHAISATQQQVLKLVKG